jgi:UDP-3-O-[3-hydroxymyristoyl] glucosamine N-acyltransferase
MLLAQSGVAGSTHLGERVILAGQSGVGGHLKLGDGVRVGAGSKVLKGVEAGQDVFGAPAGPKQETLRAMAFLPRLRAELSKLKGRLRALEEKNS